MNVSDLQHTKAMFGLDHEQVFAAFANLLSNESIAIIHMHYPMEDERNHKSLDTLVAALSGHGFSETAELVEKQVPVLVTRNLGKAIKVIHEIQRDSVAISATLFYNGKTGLEAEELLYQDSKGE